MLVHNSSKVYCIDRDIRSTNTGYTKKNQKKDRLQYLHLVNKNDDILHSHTKINYI